MQHKNIKRIVDTYLDNEMPADIRDRFFGWLRSSANRDDKERALESYWERLDAAETLDRASKLERLHRDIRRRSLRRFVRFAAAAAILIAAIVGIDFIAIDNYLRRNVRTEIVTTDCDKGECTLPDGSKIWLNSGSVLRYYGDFADGKRIVELEGEGFFKVSRDPSRPFILKTDDMDIEVLGTEFDVINYKDFGTTEAILCSGSIRASGGRLPTPVVMRPGDRLVYDKKSGRTTLQQVDASNYSQWFNDTIAFDNMPMTDILINLERRYAIEIDAPEQWANSLRMTFKIKHNEDIDDVLHAMSLVVGIRYTREGRRITVIPDAGAARTPHGRNGRNRS